ncbi:hypothetical protein KAR91_51460, partial [Candidatus Pacearchaeota archaeon]|nr:hypothetical protein [Candidatus Pacearchaeota archaeon]
FKKKWGSRDKPYFYYVAVNNKKILELTKQDILNEYNDFFVIPFNELKHSGEVKYETPVKKDS